MAADHTLALAETGVTLVINLMQLAESKVLARFIDPYEPVLQNGVNAQGRNIRIVHFPIQDRSIPTVAQMKSILQAIR